MDRELTEDAAKPAKRRSRSDYERGPQKGRLKAGDDRRHKSARTLRVPYGGYGLREAQQLLAKGARESGIDLGNETHLALTRAIVVAARRWRRIANDRVRHLNQNMARLEILYLVGYSGEELTQSQLAELVSVKGSTMVHMLHALAQEGLIERHQSSYDRRITVNRITELGQEKARDIMAELRLLREELFADIDATQLKTTLDTIGQILEKLERMQQAESSPKS